MVDNARVGTFCSLVFMPILMGLGHLSPAIGAIHTATGSYQFPGALLGMIGTAAALVDSSQAHDAYNDLPVPRRPRVWLWRLWMCSLWSVVLTCTFLCGLETSIQMYRFAFIGLSWGTPCIPHLSPKTGLNFLKPKAVLLEAKSLVVAICMACVCAETSMFYYCHRKDAQCTPQPVRMQSLGLATLYQFLRETACDIRDIEEDTKEGLKTLPVRLGKDNTLLLMAILGMFFDAFLTRAIDLTWSSGAIDSSLLLSSIGRVTLTMAIYFQALSYPRSNCWAWGTMSLLGLLPVFSAQATLLQTDRSIAAI